MARLLERYRMSFELAAPLRPGDAVDFRVLLAAEERSGPIEVRGSLRIVRILDAHPDAPSLFSAEIIDVRRDDLPELEAWLARYSTPQGRRFEALTGSSEFEPEVDIDESGSVATDAVDPLDLPTGAMGETVSSAPFGLTEETDHQDLRLAGREAIRSALRRGLQTRSGRGLATPSRSAGRDAWLRQTRDRALRQARAWLEPDAVHAAAPAVDPTVEIQDELAPIQVRVRWTSATRYRDDFKRHLQGGGLFVPTPRPLPRNAAVELHLHLPSGEALVCNARVVAPMPTGAGMSLELSPAHTAMLAQEG